VHRFRALILKFFMARLGGYPLRNFHGCRFLAYIASLSRKVLLACGHCLITPPTLVHSRWIYTPFGSSGIHPTLSSRWPRSVSNGSHPVGSMDTPASCSVRNFRCQIPCLHIKFDLPSNIPISFLVHLSGMCMSCFTAVDQIFRIRGKKRFTAPFICYFFYKALKSLN